MADMPHVENVELVKKCASRDADVPGFGLLFASIVTLSLVILFLLVHFII